MIDRSNLAVAKFARDLVMDPTNTRDVEKYGNAVYLPYVDPFIPFEVENVPDCRNPVVHCWTIPAKSAR